MVLFNLPDQGSNGISPSFTHTTSFAKAETTTVGGTTGKSGRETMTVFVDDNTSLEVTIPPGSGDVPHIHSHSGHGSVGRSHKVGTGDQRKLRVTWVRVNLLVESGPILGVEDDGITTSPTFTKVVGLEVTRELIETESVEQVMVHVAGVEELGDDKVDVLFGGETFRLSILVNKDHAIVDGSVVVHKVRLSFPVFMGDTIVTSGSVEDGGVVGGGVHTVDVERVGRGWDLVPSEGGSYSVPWLDLDRDISEGRVVDT